MNRQKRDEKERDMAMVLIAMVILSCIAEAVSLWFR